MWVYQLHIIGYDLLGSSVYFIEPGTLWSRNTHSKHQRYENVEIAHTDWPSRLTHCTVTVTHTGRQTKFLAVSDYYRLQLNVNTNGWYYSVFHLPVCSCSLSVKVRMERYSDDNISNPTAFRGNSPAALNLRNMVGMTSQTWYSRGASKRCRDFLDRLASSSLILLFCDNLCRTTTRIYTGRNY